MSKNVSSFRSAVLRYGRLLDLRQYEGWLRLFSEDAVYQVIQREHHERGEPLFLINERLPALRARVSAYCDAHDAAFLHFFSDIPIYSDADQEVGGVHAACLIFERGQLLHVANYSFTFNEEDKPDHGGLLDQVLVVLEAPSIRVAITAPI